MLLHSVIEEQHHISKRRVQLTGNHPGTRLVWALEVEKNHTERLITLIRSVCRATDLIVSVPESLSGFTSASTRRDESYDSNSLSKAASKTQSVHNTAKGGSNLIFSCTNLVIETILPMEAFRAVRRMFFVPHSCHDPICIVSHPDFTSLFSHDTAPPSDGKAVGRRSAEEMERSLLSTLRRITNFKVQTSPKELSKYLEDMIKTSQNGQQCDLISFTSDCSAEARTSNAFTDQITKENNKSSIPNEEGHTHLLQCIYGSHDGIFRWGITEKKESLDFKLTAESIEYGICHERQNRFERDGLSHNGGNFHPGVHVHSGGLNGVEGSATKRDLKSGEIGECGLDLIGILHDQESCSLINLDSDRNKNENKKEFTPSILQNIPTKSQAVTLDSERFLSLQEMSIHNKSVESVENLQKKMRASESFKPASRAYYKMSEIKEFYFPLWKWTWPGDEEEGDEKKVGEGDGVGERGLIEDHAEGRDDQGGEEDEREGGEGEAEFKKTSEATREKKLEKCRRGIEYERKSRNGSRNQSRSKIQCCAIDVGASPGGWTQCLAAHCARVLSVDPGVLREDVLKLKNVEYVCGTIESVLALNAMQRISENRGEHLNECHGKSYSVFNSTGSDQSMTHFNAKNFPRNSGLRVAVCDVNIGAVTAATLLSSYVLPHMRDACKCRCSVSLGKSCTHNDGSSSSIRSGKNVVNTSDNDLEEKVDYCDNNYDNNNDDDDDNNNRGRNVNNNGIDIRDNSIDEAKSQILKMSIDDTIHIRNSTNKIEMCGKNLTNNEKKSITCKKNRKCCCGGYVILTLKLVKNAKESYIKNAVDSASVILAAAGCYDFHAVHLGANSRNERTLVCRFTV